MSQQADADPGSPAQKNAFAEVLAARGLLHAGQRRKAAIAVLLILCATVMDLFSLAAIAPVFLLVVDTSVIHSNTFVHAVYEAAGIADETRFLVAVIVCVLFLFVLKGLISMVISHYQARFVYEAATDLSRRAFVAYYNEDYLTVTARGSAVPARNIQQAPIEFSVHVLLAAINLASEFIIFFLVLTGIAIYDFRGFLLLLVVLGPATWFFYALKRRRLEAIGKTSETLKPASMKHLYQGIRSYVDVKLQQKAKFFVNRYIHIQERLNRSFAAYNAYSQLPARLIETAAVLGVATILIYGLLFLSTPNEIVLLVSLYTVAAYRALPSLNRMAIALMNIKTFQHTIAILRRAIADPAGTAGQGPVGESDEPMAFSESIAFAGISFSYGDDAPFALQDVSFSVRKGEAVGFIGPSGAGKTTVMNILLRLLQEKAGHIAVDGRPLRPGDTSAWRRLIGTVRQDPVILDATIAENIAFGETPGPEHTAQISRAMRQAGLDEFVAQLPDGLQTQVGEYGSRLSGGQRQRIAIARALYRDAEIMVFDEATSELDSETESDVVDAMAQLSRQGRTIFVISHRLTTLRHCHRIYEMDQGRMAGVQRFDEMTGKETQSAAG